MQAVVCPHCRIRVAPSSEGICPSCRRDIRQVIPADAEVVQPSQVSDAVTNHCPGCAAAIPPNAVLCVACGYHLPTGSYLSTSIERRPDKRANPFGDEVPNSLGTSPVSNNPYAPSSVPVQQSAESSFVSDLAPHVVRQAGAIASEAEMLVWAIVLGICICPPVLLVMFPWYGFRLHSWYRLNSLCYELREPNGFSPHCQIAVRFQDALPRLWVGTILGGIFWALFALTVLAQVLVELSHPSLR